MRRFIITLAVVLSAALAAAPARAQDFGISEIRLGVMYHDVYNGWLPVSPDRYQGFNAIEDVSFEVLFHTPSMEAFYWLGMPRPSLGATISTTGRESFARLGLTFQAYIPTTPFFVEGTLGGAVHNGALEGAEAPARNFGCQFGFYSNASLGVALPAGFSAMVTYEHVSNGDLCPPNEGLSNLGFRIGKSF